MLQNFPNIAVFFALDLRAEAHGLFVEALLDDLVDAVEGASADEHDVRRVDVNELLMRVLAPALGRHGGYRALKNLQQRLLHALAGDIAGDGGILALAGDLIQLIDVDDALLGALHIEIRRLQQPEQDVLDVLSHIAGLGQRRRVRDGEGDVQHPGHGLGKQSFAAAGGADEQNVALLQLHIVVRVAEADALVVVIDRHAQRDFGPLLADDVIVQHLADLCRLRQFAKIDRAEASSGVLTVKTVVLFADHAHTQAHAVVADIGAVSGNQPVHLLLLLAAEGAPDRLCPVSSRHTQSFVIS